MRTNKFTALFVIAAFIAACADQHNTTGPSIPSIDTTTLGSASNNSGKPLTVMTRNVYLGADLNPVIGAPSPQLIPIRVADVWAAVQHANFTERAQALADEIVESDVDLVGLQEVSLWRTQFPGDAHLPNSIPATEVVYDYLEILLQALRDRGKVYSVAASVENVDAELFMFTGTPGASLTRDIRMTDRDVILIKSSLSVFNSRSAQYNARITIPVGGAGGPTITIARGWTSTDVKYRGETFRFFNTHLEVESAPFGPVQIAQGNEVAAMLAASPYPVIAVGDYNSAADGSQTPTYATLLASGFTDVWSQVNPSDPGLSAGMSSDLLGPVSLFATRIDFVFFKGPMSGVSARLVGNTDAERTLSGLMPSDHAGVVATINLKAK